MSPDVPSLAWVAEMLLSNTLLILLTFAFLAGISLLWGHLGASYRIANTSKWFSHPRPGQHFRLGSNTFHCVLRVGHFALIKEL